MANQIIIDIGAVANDGTGDPLRTAFGYVNDNFSNVWATGVANSNVAFDGNKILTVNTNGNLVLAPNGTGKVVANVDIVPNTANTRNLGALNNRWSTVYAQYLNVSGNVDFGGNIDLSGDLTVDGNLTVSGTDNNVVVKSSGFVNAGSFVTLDNIKATMTTTGNRGLSLATVSGTVTGYVSGSYTLITGSPGGSAASVSLTTSPSTSILGQNFLGEGDTAIYVLRDNTNSRVYRITLMIGGGYNNNMISIERLI